MLENILLAIVMPLVNAGEYFVGYSHAISECWRIFCWYCLALLDAGEYFFAFVMPIVNAEENFVCYFLAISECWRIFCCLLSSHW